MAISNHERVGKALALFNEGLRPYAERELKTYHGARWVSEVKEVLTDTRLGGGKGDAMQDVAVQLTGETYFGKR
jgi:Swt1-like HEPN